VRSICKTYQELKIEDLLAHFFLIDIYSTSTHIQHMQDMRELLNAYTSSLIALSNIEEFEKTAYAQYDFSS